MLPDQAARDEAISPEHSLIVQAPAGSGKTEILTQRFLNLLCTVKAPEEVVALTFTRKAAHEMRERILDRLQKNPKVLAHDKKHDWHLLSHPNRLRITTIDSLCQRITSAMPLTQNYIPYAKIIDTPDTCYWEAARNCFSHATKDSTYHDALKTLLSHLDNRTDTLLNLWVEQLALRDSWLSPVLYARYQTKSHLEAGLKQIEAHAIEQFKATIPKNAIHDLITLTAHVARIENIPTSPRYPLTTWQSLDELNREKALALASMLLTTQNTLRKSFDHHVGLKKTYTDKATFDTLKSQSRELLESLSEAPGFTEALQRLCILPTPHYPDSSWEPLQALLVLQPLLASHLQLVFESHLATDFTGITLAALDALGDNDAPSDLALHLDYRIQHLLIDEFQDTSIQQFELITRLTRGFDATDGRTLFVVGDPMQSIYRFRSAEVGLFLRAQQEGIGDVKLKPLYLEANFRTVAPLVDWFNDQFAAIFPKNPDIESGAVAFHKAIAKCMTLPDTTSPLCAEVFDTPEAEAEAIARLCKIRLHDAPDETIAILVRSRHQLPLITQALSIARVPYQGLDTDLLMNLAHVQDVYSLTQALLMPGNRLAWLSLLRSPLIGFELSDVYLIANYLPKESILQAITSADCIAGLSQSGQIRAKFIAKTLTDALKARHEYPLVTFILNTLKTLHLPKVYSSETLKDLEPFFELLEQFEGNGILKAPDLFEKTLYQRYKKQPGDAKVQVMTIHKAKGLEFDTVILPGLGKRPPKPSQPLLRWLMLPRAGKETLLLISPLHKTHGERDLLYDYLGAIDTEKNRYEQERLLYVAVTRAKKRLFCFDHHAKVHPHTFRSAMKLTTFQPAVTEITHKTRAIDLPKRIYLPDAFYDIKARPTVKPQILNPLTELPLPNHARIKGIVTHELLEWICTYHPKTTHDIPWSLIKPSLLAAGLLHETYADAISQIQQWIQTLFEHPKGQWLIQKHLNERNEYAVLIKVHQQTKTYIIDRIFETSDACWIIDFKTGEKSEMYQTQLNLYAKAIRNETSLPIHCGIYYLNSGEWIEWASSEKYAIMSEFNTEILER